MGDIVTVKDQPLFKKEHELKKILPKLKKMTAEAMRVLEKCLESKDERLQFMAADRILKAYHDTAKEINQDQLKRTILEIRAKGVLGAGSTSTDDDDDDTPTLDFDNIAPEFAEAENVVDMSDVNKIG